MTACFSWIYTVVTVSLTFLLQQLGLSAWCSAAGMSCACFHNGEPLMEDARATHDGDFLSCWVSSQQNPREEETCECVESAEEEQGNPFLPWGANPALQPHVTTDQPPWSPWPGLTTTSPRSMAWPHWWAYEGGTGAPVGLYGGRCPCCCQSSRSGCSSRAWSSHGGVFTQVDGAGSKISSTGFSLEDTRDPNFQQFLGEILSNCGGLGKSGVPSQGMWAKSLNSHSQVWWRFVRGHHIHRSCAIYFPGGIVLSFCITPKTNMASWKIT